MRLQCKPEISVVCEIPHWTLLPVSDSDSLFPTLPLHFSLQIFSLFQSSTHFPSMVCLLTVMWSYCPHLSTVSVCFVQNPQCKHWWEGDNEKRGRGWEGQMNLYTYKHVSRKTIKKNSTSNFSLTLPPKCTPSTYLLLVFSSQSGLFPIRPSQITSHI